MVGTSVARADKNLELTTFGLIKRDKQTDSYILQMMTMAMVATVAFATLIIIIASIFVAASAITIMHHPVAATDVLTIAKKNFAEIFKQPKMVLSINQFG